MILSTLIWLVLLLYASSHAHPVDDQHDQPKKDPSSVSETSIPKRTRTPPALDADTYERILQALKRGHHGATKEAKQEHKDWYKVSRFLRQWPEVTVRRMYNPVSGALEERLVFPAQDSSVRMMIRSEEINQILENFFLETVGDGAAKLAKRIQKVFVGLNKINIQKWLNTKPSVQKTQPLFRNCAPLIPVQASRVMERNQIDLVDMRNVGGKDSRFHYILSVIDVFSRYIFLKPLETKSSEGVASVLMRIYNEFGPPRILQSDRGTEFKGAVQELMSRLGVRVILSAPYKPQSQGKAERSHGTWKSKLRLQLEELKSDDDNFQWVDSLETVTRLYNEGYHSSLGMSPFEVFFGRKTNRQENLISVGHQLPPEDIEVQMEDHQHADVPEENILSMPVNAEEIKEFLGSVDATRRTAKQQSDKTSARMVAKKLRRNPPSAYSRGDKVFVRVKKARVTRGGNPLHRPLVNLAEIIEVNSKTFTYKVRYLNTSANRKTGYVSINDITSTTRQEEEERQQRARTEAKQKAKKCMCPDATCKRRPADGCTHNFNAICCEKQGRRCRLHKVQPSTCNLKFKKYSISTPSGIDKVIHDITKAMRQAMRFPKSRNEQNLDDNIASAGLMYREPRTPGDGNCLFHAISDQLSMRDIQTTHVEVRERLVAYLMENQYTRDGTHMGEWLVNRDWESYLSEMSRDGVWGDELMLIAAANVYENDITIISSIPGESIRILTPQDVNPQTPSFLLGHLSELHYFSLQVAPRNHVDIMQETSEQTVKIKRSQRLLKTKSKSEQSKGSSCLGSRIVALVDQVSSMSRSQVLSEMEVPIGRQEMQFETTEQVEKDHALLGIDDLSRYWAAHLAENGRIIPLRNQHFYVSDSELDEYVEYCNKLKENMKQRKVSIFYIDLVVIFWLFTVGKIDILKQKDSVRGSFIFLSDDDAEVLDEFRYELYREWNNEHDCED